MFGPNGLVVENGSNGEPAAAAAVVVQPDGKTVAAGEVPTVNGVETVGLIRVLGPTVSVSNAPTVSVPPAGSPTFQQGTLNFLITLTEPLPLTACPMLSAVGPGTVMASPSTCPAPTMVGIASRGTSGAVVVTINMAGVPPGSSIGEQVTAISGNGLTAAVSTASGTVKRVFNALPGAANEISIGANSATWIIGTSSVPGGHGIYHWTGSGWSIVSGGAVNIAVDPAGNPWLINSLHQIFHRNGNGWALQPGAANDISVGANGAVWVIGTNAVGGGFAIYHWTGSGWSVVSGGGVSIAVDPAGNPWLINLRHQIFHRSGNAWVLQPGAASDISAGANGAAWIIGTKSVPGGDSIYYFSGGTWVGVPGGAVRVAVDPTGEPWLINASHTIFES